MNDLIDKVDDAVAELDGVRNELDDFGDDVDDLEEEIEDAGDKIGDVETAVKELANQFNSLKLFYENQVENLGNEATNTPQHMLLVRTYGTIQELLTVRT